MTRKRSYLRTAAALLAALLLSVLTAAAAETAEGPQPLQTVFFFDQGREMDLWQKNDTLRVFCIPVGAQDCYFITCEGHAMVLDCAGVGREPTPDLLFRLCDALGVTRLDIAFNTYPHRDHINGFAELLSKIPADEYLSTFPLDSDKYQRQLIHQLRELSIPIRVCEAGEVLKLGSAQLETYRYMGTKNTNDRSMVVHIRYGDRSILFTADIGLTAQRVLATENAEHFKSDILKLPHHGVGGISPQLLDAVSPELCFVSNGPTSRDVKLQKTAVLKRNIPLYFTSRQPLVLLTDGKIWEAQQWPADSLMLPWYQYQPEQAKK